MSPLVVRPGDFLRPNPKNKKDYQLSPVVPCGRSRSPVERALIIIYFEYTKSPLERLIETTSSFCS